MRVMALCVTSVQPMNLDTLLYLLIYAKYEGAQKSSSTNHKLDKFRLFFLFSYRISNVSHSLALAFLDMVAFVAVINILPDKVVKILDFRVREVHSAIHFHRCIKIHIQVII